MVQGQIYCLPYRVVKIQVYFPAVPESCLKVVGLILEAADLPGRLHYRQKLYGPPWPCAPGECKCLPTSPGIVIVLPIVEKFFNPFSADATFIQSTRTQIILKII